MNGLALPLINTPGCHIKKQTHFPLPRIQSLDYHKQIDTWACPQCNGSLYLDSSEKSTHYHCPGCGLTEKMDNIYTKHCPQCTKPLLSDDDQCPTCGYDLDFDDYGQSVRGE